jgi:hypothetical protein
MEINIGTKTKSGALVALILGFAYFSISYFPVDQGIAYLFIGLTVLMTSVFLYYLNGVMNKRNRPEGYNPKPTQPTVYQPLGQTISDQSIGDNSFGNKMYVINGNAIFNDSDKESKMNKTSTE